MPIEGPVRELALSDLLQLLFLSRRTGRLVVSDEAAGLSTVLELEGGALVGATSSAGESRIGDLLIGSGRATEEQIRSAVEAQRTAPERRLGEILVARGAVRESEVRRHLRLQIEEAVFDLMRWVDGHVRFEETPARASAEIEVRLPVDGVLMEAVRRLDEWAEVTGSLPDPDPLPILAAGANGSGGSLSLEPVEWEVLAKVDGEATLQRIARGLGRTELEVARALYGLVEAGIVEISPRSGGPSGAADWEAEVRGVEEALRAGWLEEADRRVAALLVQRPAAAPVFVLHGRILSERGDHEAAIRAFHRAVELDPLLSSAYFHLARASLRGGELARGRRALNTYRRLSDTSNERREIGARMSEGLERLMAALEEAVE